MALLTALNAVTQALPPFPGLLRYEQAATKLLISTHSDVPHHPGTLDPLLPLSCLFRLFHQGSEKSNQYSQKEGTETPLHSLCVSEFYLLLFYLILIKFLLFINNSIYSSLCF